MRRPAVAPPTRTTRSNYISSQFCYNLSPAVLSFNDFSLLSMCFSNTLYVVVFSSYVLGSHSSYCTLLFQFQHACITVCEELNDDDDDDDDWLMTIRRWRWWEYLVAPRDALWRHWAAILTDGSSCQQLNDCATATSTPHLDITAAAAAAAAATTSSSSWYHH